MSENISQILKEYESELEKCSVQYNSILEKIKELETNLAIKEYNKLKADLSILSKQYDELKDEYMHIYQTNCKHPLWYFMNDDTDRFEGRQKWVCKCIKCGIIEGGHSSDFKGKLIIESGNMGFGERCLSDYDDVRSEYLNLESSGEKQKSIVRTLIKKYNNQKQEK